MWGKAGDAGSRTGYAEPDSQNGPEIDSGDVPATSAAQIRSGSRLADSAARKPATVDKSVSNRF